MSWPARSRGGRSGVSTRTARPPSSFSPTPASRQPLGQRNRLGQRIVGDGYLANGPAELPRLLLHGGEVGVNRTIQGQYGRSGR